MKKFYLLLVLLSITLTACRSKEERSEIIIKQKEVGSRIPVPKFNDIDLYLKESYNQVSWDNIRREAYINENPHLDIRTRELILNGRVRIGMTKEEVTASIGAAENKIKTITDFGVREEWIYRENLYIFNNGVLTNIREI